LQVSGQVVSFMTGHGLPDSVSGDHGADGTSFRRGVRSFATAHQVPIVAFEKLDEDVPSPVEFRWRPGEHQASLMC
jgi:hypothetical protein